MATGYTVLISLRMSCQNEVPAIDLGMSERACDMQNVPLRESVEKHAASSSVMKPHADGRPDHLPLPAS